MGVKMMQTTCKEARPSRQEDAAPMSTQDENIIAAVTYEDEVSRLLEGSCPPVGTSDDAAALIGVTSAAMREFCRQGKIHAFKAGTVWRIPRPALLRFMLGGGGVQCSRP